MTEGYWDATSEYLKHHKKGPTCPRCGEEMFPQDDHGCFTCFCNLGSGINTRTGLPFGNQDVKKTKKEGGGG